MKRCPHCLFIYPDTDSVCDFDQTTLVAVTEAELADATNTAERSKTAETQVANINQTRKNWRAILLAGAFGMILGIVIVGVSAAIHRRIDAAAAAAKQTDALPFIPATTATPSSVASPSAQTEASPETTVEATKSTSAKTVTAHSSTSTGPVSTSARTRAQNGKAMILLTTGGKIDADEVWQTKDGVWYRRAGIVTLLTRNRVKAVVRQ
jgi:hypothetical protein